MNDFLLSLRRKLTVSSDRVNICAPCSKMHHVEVWDPITVTYNHCWWCLRWTHVAVTKPAGEAAHKRHSAERDFYRPKALSDD